MSDSPVDEEALFELVDEDPAFLNTLVETFLDDCEVYMEALRTAVEEDDPVTLQEEAHGLKGAVANMKAKPAREAARRLEELGQDGAVDEADRALERLETEIKRLRKALGTMLENY
jgi:HPt (histidine-containing phosphotransfer) domain-containing protein